MDIKGNSANIVSISRIFVAFVAIGLLYFDTTDQGLNSCATAIGANWSSDAGSDE